MNAVHIHFNMDRSHQVLETIRFMSYGARMEGLLLAVIVGAWVLQNYRDITLCRQ